MDVLNKFLQAEINSKEYYESIINFINLYEIRKGEFEGNEYVIMKMVYRYPFHYQFIKIACWMQLIVMLKRKVLFN